MNKPRIYDIGEAAIAYMKKAMGDGLSLSKQVLQALDLSRGHIYTMLPDGVDTDLIRDYSVGGFTCNYADRKNGVVQVTTIDEHVITLIRSFLAKSGNPVCLFDATLLELDFPTVRRIRTHAIFQKEVYLYLGPGQNTLDQIGTIMYSSAGSYPPVLASLAVLSSEGVCILRSGRLSLQFLRETAEATEHIIVGAFDGEGYLIWDKVSN